MFLSWWPQRKFICGMGETPALWRKLRWTKLLFSFSTFISREYSLSESTYFTLRTHFPSLIFRLFTKLLHFGFRIGTCFWKVPRTLRVRKSRCQTTIRLLWNEDVFNPRKTKMLAEFHGLEPGRCEEIKGIMAPEIGSNNFGTFEKQVPGNQKFTGSTIC